MRLITFCLFVLWLLGFQAFPKESADFWTYISYRTHTHRRCGFLHWWPPSLWCSTIRHSSFLLFSAQGFVPIMGYSYSSCGPLFIRLHNCFPKQGCTGSQGPGTVPWPSKRTIHWISWRRWFRTRRNFERNADYTKMLITMCTVFSE